MDLGNVLHYVENELEIDITMNDFSSFFKNVAEIEANNYVLIGEDNLVYKFKGPKNLTIKFAVEIDKPSLIKPDYTNSLINIVASFKKYYHKETNVNSIEELDDILKTKYKHIMFLILDGMGANMVNNILDEDDFLRKHFLKTISALYPSTTACAIPASKSGLIAYDTGWLGWNNYFTDLKKSLVLFTGNDYYTGEPTGIDIRKQFLPYDSFFENLGVKYYELEPDFVPNGHKTFRDLLHKFKKITYESEPSFTYAYWNEPDSSFHKNGVYSNESKSVLKNISLELENISSQLNDETLIVITADHGHKDTMTIPLYEFKELNHMLEHEPSNESRALCFKVKQEYKEEFPRLFNRYFNSIYKLYTKDEFIKEGFLGKTSGKINHYLDEFLGDFIAVALSNYSFKYYINSPNFKAEHSGLTKPEMETPLIIFTKKRKA